MCDNVILWLAMSICLSRMARPRLSTTVPAKRRREHRYSKILLAHLSSWDLASSVGDLSRGVEHSRSNLSIHHSVLFETLP